MSALSWLLWAVLSAVAAAASLWHYQRRETPGRGRTLLALFRAGALVLLLLLLFDPELPTRGSGGTRGTQVLLDASLSMQLPAGDGRTRWRHAVERARARAGGRPVLLFGDVPRGVAPAALPDSAPGDAHTRLLPALQAAAEAGSRRVLVITDGAIEDGDAVARWAARLGLRLEVETVGEDVANLAIAEASAPAWVAAGAPVPVEFGVTGAAPSDSVTVVALAGGRVIGRATVPAPAPGRIATGAMELRLDAPPAGGWLPLQLVLENTDRVPDDDRRDLYVQVSDEPAGIALVSLRPDWEPRFLAPVLEQALGLPLHAYLRGATGRYVRLAGGLEAGAAATDDEVRRAVQRAALVVLHGVGVDAPAWAADAVAGAHRALIFPAGDGAGIPFPVSVGAEQQGDYFAAAAVPPSPVARLLSDVDVAAVAPLSSMRSVDMPVGAWAPLMATRGRQGAPQPLMVAGEAGTRRWAVALGSGYWQWAFRGGSERQLYVRLWSAMAGWLTRERGLAALAPVRPARITNPRAAPLPWVAPGIAADSITLTITDAAGAVVLDTTIAPVRDTAYSAAPPSGHYRYRARAFTGDSLAQAEGVLVVETYSAEFGRARTDLSGLATLTADTRNGDRIAVARGMPLHATAFPYILLVTLLAAEWILRRRWGLR
ncbi:MAG TPA: hypothetical protein VMN60_03920 [Longimicrobiales bacterium]|nr:hypothetical protein [Longimicrobiales bacterium]